MWNSNTLWKNTPVGFGEYDEGFDVECMGGKVDCLTKSDAKEIGFFVGFGFIWDGSCSHWVGLSFVTKFGWVVTCHCIVCTSWLHKPWIIEQAF